MAPTGSSLPIADYYFLHPCLHSLVYKSRYGDGYEFFRNIVVGHNYPWPIGMREVFQLQRALFKIDNRDVKKAALQWLSSTMSKSVSIGELSIDDQCQAAMLADELDRNGCEDAWVALQSFCESRGIDL